MSRHTSDDDTEDSNDEISEIKNAMRICRTRQKAFHDALGEENKHVIDTKENEVENSQIYRSLKKQHCEAIVKLEKKCMALEDELNYTKKILKTKEKNLQEETQLVDLKVQAIDAEYKQSYTEMKKILCKNNKMIKAEVVKLLYALSMLERNTLHGRHLTLSETNVGLLLKMRSSLEDISNACNDPEKKNSSGASSEMDDDPVSNAQAPLVDTTLLEICKHLEDENCELKARVENDQLELQKCRSKASKASLIPHYRAAILKANDDNKALRKEMENDKDEMLSLQAILDKKLIEIQQLEAKVTKLDVLHFQLKEERDKYKSVIYDVIEDKQPGLYKNMTTHVKDVSNNRRRKSPMRHVSGKSCLINQEKKLDTRTKVAPEELIGRESLMQENLSALDCEIDNLRQRLELAAAARTQAVMSDVISGTNVGTRD